MLEDEQRARPASALSPAVATEEDWDFPEDSGVDLMDDSPSLAHVSPEGGDDWLTSIPEPLGPPATTLDAIRDGGSFPPGSKSPAFYFHEAQHPGQGAKYLTALAFKVNPTEVAKEEAEFHLRMTKFLTGLTQTDQEELAYFMLHLYNARDDTLNIFETTTAPTSIEDFRDYYINDKNSVAKNVPTAVVAHRKPIKPTNRVKVKLASSTFTMIDRFYPIRIYFL